MLKSPLEKKERYLFSTTLCNRRALENKNSFDFIALDEAEEEEANFSSVLLREIAGKTGRHVSRETAKRRCM